MCSELTRLIKQFLSGLPVNELTFSTISLNVESQDILLCSTVNSDLVLKYPLKVDYQRAFVKYLLSKLESQNLEVHENLYETYGRLVSLPDLNREYYKHYIIGEESKVITLKEDVHLISEGTTGLRTWQAALALSEWCLNNKTLLENKRLLELGSGIGLTGLVVSLECHPKTYCFSDCHASVLASLTDNIKLNCEVTKDSINNHSSECLFQETLRNCVEVSVLNLPWEKVDGKFATTFGHVDVILAADIVYDSELFPYLISALITISKASEVKDIIFACTERNRTTLETFLRAIGQHFSISPQPCPDQAYFVWSKSPAVKIFKFTYLNG